MTVFRYRVSTQKNVLCCQSSCFRQQFGCTEFQKFSVMSERRQRCPKISSRKVYDAQLVGEMLNKTQETIGSLCGRSSSIIKIPIGLLLVGFSRKRLILGSRPQSWNASFTSSHSQPISCLVATFGLAATSELANPDPRQFLDYIRFRLAELCGGDVGARNVRVFLNSGWRLATGAQTTTLRGGQERTSIFHVVQTFAASRSALSSSHAGST